MRFAQTNRKEAKRQITSEFNFVVQTLRLQSNLCVDLLNFHSYRCFGREQVGSILFRFFIQSVILSVLV